MRTIKIFLASSLNDGLTIDRAYFGNFIRRLNNVCQKRNITIDLFECEDYDTAYNGIRKQDEYNAQIYDSDLFIALFHTKAGIYTLEELKVATKSRQKRNTPQVFACFKDVANNLGNKNIQEVRNQICNELKIQTWEYTTPESLQLLIILLLMQVEDITKYCPLTINQTKILIDGLYVGTLNDLPYTQQKTPSIEMLTSLITRP